MEPAGNSNSSVDRCPPQSCPAIDFYEYVPDSPIPCFCAAPIGVWYRLRSPSMSNFRPFVTSFKTYLTSNLEMDLYQLVVENPVWISGPKLIVYLKFFPQYKNTGVFNANETKYLIEKFSTMALPLNNFFGPYDLLNFTLRGHYKNCMPLELYCFPVSTQLQILLF